MVKLISVIAVSLCMTISSSALAVDPDLLRKCQLCHGKLLSGKKKNPPIAGMAYDDVLASLTTAIPKKMEKVAGKLTEEQKVDLSKYISGLGGQNDGDR
jgi:cytochrome c553